MAKTDRDPLLMLEPLSMPTKPLAKLPHIVEATHKTDEDLLLLQREDEGEDAYKMPPITPIKPRITPTQTKGSLCKPCSTNEPVKVSRHNIHNFGYVGRSVLTLKCPPKGSEDVECRFLLFSFLALGSSDHLLCGGPDLLSEI
jgi:hypothetical protein